MGYYIDLSEIPIEDYQEMLETRYLIPSQIVLRENIDKNFDIIKAQGINHVEQLRLALNSKKKLLAFAEQSGIAESYLKILIRHINGFRQKPTKISDLPDTTDDTVQMLAKQGIKNTLQLYDHILTPEARETLADQTKIRPDEIVRLTRLTDLCRIKWVNHTFAYVLLEAGYDSVAGVRSADHETLYQTIKQLNTEREIFKGNIGLNDMKLCIESAKELSLDIVY